MLSDKELDLTYDDVRECMIGASKLSEEVIATANKDDLLRQIILLIGAQNTLLLGLYDETVAGRRRASCASNIGFGE